MLLRLSSQELHGRWACGLFGEGCCVQPGLFVWRLGLLLNWGGEQGACNVHACGLPQPSARIAVSTACLLLTAPLIHPCACCRLCCGRPTVRLPAPGAAGCVH